MKQDQQLLKKVLLMNIWQVFFCLISDINANEVFDAFCKKLTSSDSYLRTLQILIHHREIEKIINMQWKKPARSYLRSWLTDLWKTGNIFNHYLNCLESVNWLLINCITVLTENVYIFTWLRNTETEPLSQELAYNIIETVLQLCKQYSFKSKNNYSFPTF